MCSMGIIEEQCCHGSASTLSQTPLEDEQMTCLYYASIAYTVVNLVNYLFPYASYSYADASSMFCPPFEESHCERSMSYQHHFSPRLEAHKLRTCDTHVTWVRLAHAPETVFRFPYPRQSLQKTDRSCYTASVTSRPLPDRSCAPHAIPCLTSRVQLACSLSLFRCMSQNI